MTAKRKSFLLALTAFIGVFCFSFNSQAASPYDNRDISAGVIFNQSAGGSEFFQPVFSSFSGSGIVNTFSFYGQFYTTTPTQCDTVNNQFSRNLRFYYGGTDHNVAVNWLTHVGTPGWYDVDVSSFNMTFTQLANAQIFWYTQAINTMGSSCNVQLQIYGSSSATYWTHYNNDNANGFPAVELNGSIDSPSLTWTNPPMTDNFTSPDFHNWWLNENIPSNHDPAITGYYFDVTMGTSSPIGIATDSLLSIIGILPLGSSQSINDSPLLTKQATSSPGTYQAQGTMFDQSGNILAQTSVLHFTITGNGNFILNVPNNNGGATSTIPNLGQGCAATSFNVLGADVGQGICNTVQYLFVPNQATLNQWVNTQTLMASKAPFSYLYELGEDLSELATSSSASITPLTLTIGATGTPINFSFDAFSSNTINKYTNSTVRGVLRTLIQWSLYLAFIAMVILEVRKIFSKPKQ